MLVIEVNPTTNERRVVFHRDWHQGWLSSGYVAPRKNFTGGSDMDKLQRALLRRTEIGHFSQGQTEIGVFQSGQTEKGHFSRGQAEMGAFQSDGTKKEGSNGDAAAR